MRACGVDKEMVEDSEVSRRKTRIADPTCVEQRQKRRHV